MEAKREILEGTRWGALTFVMEVDLVPDKRSIIVECDCGVRKPVFLQYLENDTTFTCGKYKCQKKYHAKLKQSIDKLKQEFTNPQILTDKDLKDLYDFWDIVEKTGDTRMVGIGMNMTHTFLKL